MKFRQIARAFAALLTCVFLLTAAAGNAETLFVEETVLPSTPGISSADAAAGYIHARFYPAKAASGIQKAPKPQGTKLTGAERYVYDQLMPEIALIAAGERTSTEFTFPASDLYTKTTYTATELLGENVPLISNGAFTPEGNRAAAALMERCPLDTGALLSALLADAPFELYWFDKTNKGMTSSTGYSAGYTNGNYYITLTSITLRFVVASDYAATDEDVCYVVKDDFGQNVTDAVNNAAAIVARYEGQPDYQRLWGYVQEICTLTDYNHPAADDDTTPYGNPWQLVWALDNDPNTLVVCEGYAKAFKYLNDSSASSVTAVLATGWMDGGAHMWNVVTMDDGYNYLVDVTNCDQEQGITDWLFLKGFESGSFTAGYRINDILYQYRDNGFSTGDLAIVPWSYLEKPDKTLRLPRSLSAIESEAFAGLRGSVIIVLPDTVASIADDAFSGDNVILSVAEGSYAWQWAINHGWEQLVIR